MEHWSGKVPGLADKIQKLGVSGRKQALNMARYVYQQLEEAKLKGTSKTKSFEDALRDMGERALSESRSKKPNAHITHTAMRDVWLQIYNKSPLRVQNNKFIDALQKRISKDFIKQIKIKEITPQGHDETTVLRRNIDTQEVRKLQFEAETSKTAGLDPKQVKNKDKLVVKKSPKSSISSKQGIMWDKGAVFGVDEVTKERMIRKSTIETGTQRLSQFVKGKQLEYTSKMKGGGKKQDFAGLGADVSGQKVLE